MKSTADYLRDIREKLTDPKHWTQGVAARTWVSTKGEGIYEEVPCRGSTPGAHCWCLSGAIDSLRLSGFAEKQVEEALYKALSSETPGHTIASFNDSRTHGEVLTMLDNAIALEEHRAINMQRKLEMRDGGGPWN